MKVEWLESLARSVRAELAVDGIEVSHGQALDLVAAVPDLRDWLEVVAFPDRVVASRFDREAAERIVRRIASRCGLPIAFETLVDRLARTSLFYRPRSASMSTKRLVVTTTDSGAGHLKQSGIADQVITSHAFDTLVSGPVPSATGPAAFFEARAAAHDGDPLLRGRLHDWNRPDAASRRWSEVLALCEAYDRIELWIDPSANEQLLFIQMLTWLGCHPAVVEKLHVVHAGTPLGGRCADDIRTMRPRFEPVGSDALRTAERAWTAFCRPTPTSWFDLLDSDLDVLPHLGRTVLSLLGELPAVDTTLGATEHLALEIVAPGAVRPTRFFHANTQENPASVFGLADAYRILNRLAGSPKPAICGLVDDAFDVDSMNDRERGERYLQSELSLSPFGRALVQGDDDFARHNPIHRWWGGTLLTNARLWRWDADHRRLVAPRSA